MTKGAIIYQLKKNYSFRQIGEILGFSKQYVFEVYWKHWQKIKKTEDKTCDLCEKISDKVCWQEKKVKVCPDCWKEIKRIRRKKWKHTT